MSGIEPASDARLLRRGALVAGVPLAASLLVPYPMGDAWLAPWTFASEVGLDAAVVAPSAGALMVLAAVVPRVSLAVRGLLFGVAAVAAVWSLNRALVHPDVVREMSWEMRRGDVHAVQLLALAPLLAAAGEVAMQRRKGSRAWAAVATLGWLFLVSRFFVPVVPERVQSMPFLVLTEVLADLDREPAAILVVGPLFGFLLLALLQAVLAIRRLFGPEERRVVRRFRTAWTAALVGGVPGVAAALLVLLAAASQGELRLAVVAVHAGAVFWGAGLGFAFGVGHAAVLLPDAVFGLFADLRAEDARRRGRARLVVGALAAALIAALGWQVVRAIRPDPRDAALVELVSDVQTAVIAATRGEPYDESLHGGYSEFDIRASIGALREHVGGREVEPVAFAFDLSGVGARRFVARGVVHRGRLRWASLAVRYPDADPWPLAVPELAGVVERVEEGIGGGCVPVIGASDLEELPLAARDLLGPFDGAAGACGGEVDRSLRGSAAREPWGWIGPYVLIARSGERWFALHGTWSAESGRLWLGRVRVAPL